MIDLICRKMIKIDSFRFSECSRIFSPESECRHESFTVIESCKDFPSSIINRYQETSFQHSSSALKPIMVTSIILFHFSSTLFAFPHRSLNIFFSLFFYHSNPSSDEFIPESWHGDENSMFIPEFFMYHHIGVVIILRRDNTESFIIASRIAMMIRRMSTTFMNQS